MKAIRMSFLLTAIFFVLTYCAQPGANLSTSLEGKKEQASFTGVFVNTTSPLAESTNVFTIVIDRWITAEEMQQLYKAYIEEGVDAGNKAIQKMTVGYVQFAKTARWHIDIASVQLTEKGRIFRFVVDNPRIWALNDPLGVIEFTLNDKGEGDGYIFGGKTIGITEDGRIKINKSKLGNSISARRIREVKKK